MTVKELIKTLERFEEDNPNVEFKTDYDQSFSQPLNFNLVITDLRDNTITLIID